MAARSPIASSSRSLTVPNLTMSRLCGMLNSRAADRLVAMLVERIRADDARIVLHLAGLSDIEPGALPPILELRRALADRGGWLLIADASPPRRDCSPFRPRAPADPVTLPRDRSATHSGATRWR